jgi:co-chaperonin GroES (HSP10)
VTKEIEVVDKRRDYYATPPASLIVEEKKYTDGEIIERYRFAKRMLNDHILVHIDNFQYKGRIIIPEKAKHKPTKGLIVAKADNIVDLNVGDRVVISQFAGYLIKFENTPAARVISYSEILFVVDQDAPEIESEGA